jgi:hypothetical protein
LAWVRHWWSRIATLAGQPSFARLKSTARTPTWVQEGASARRATMPLNIDRAAQSSYL